MHIVRKEQTIIPQTAEGIAFAKEYEERLKSQGAFGGRDEDTQSITISAVYFFEVNAEGEE